MAEIVKKKILVVDDNKDFANMLSEILSHAYNVTTAYNPESAIAAIENNEFDGVITDKEMRDDPNAGFKVAASARAAGNMPIVMMSGDVSAAVSPAMQKRLEAIGGNISFIDKNEADLINKMLSVIEGRGQAPVHSR